MKEMFWQITTFIALSVLFLGLCIYAYQEKIRHECLKVEERIMCDVDGGAITACNPRLICIDYK